MRGSDLERSYQRLKLPKGKDMEEADRRIIEAFTTKSRADLRGLDLRKSKLRTLWSSGKAPDLSYSDLRGADLRGADLRGVNLSHSNLRYADLSGADLNGVNPDYADLRDADLSKAMFWDCFGGLAASLNHTLGAASIPTKLDIIVDEYDYKRFNEGKS